VLVDVVDTVVDVDVEEVDVPVVVVDDVDDVVVDDVCVV
jgi:hypothetical protein